MLYRRLAPALCQRWGNESFYKVSNLDILFLNPLNRGAGDEPNISWQHQIINTFWKCTPRKHQTDVDLTLARRPLYWITSSPDKRPGQLLWLWQIPGSRSGDLDLIMTGKVQANMRCRLNVGPMLGQRRRRWVNIGPTLGESIRRFLILAWQVKLKQAWDIDPMLDQCWANVADSGPTLVQHWGSRSGDSLSYHDRWSSSKHETLTQCWTNVGPTSQTVGQHWSNIG